MSASPHSESGEPLAVGRPEAARLLGVSVRTVDTMIARRELRGRRIGRRIVFTLEELRRFLTKDHPVTRKAEE